jgi:hypothetical protein
MFDLLLALYPLYQTSQAIRAPSKTKKAVYEHWIIFWFLYVCLKGVFYPLLDFAMWLTYSSTSFLFLVYWITNGILLMAYAPIGTRMLRRYLILPALRDAIVWAKKMSLNQRLNAVLKYVSFYLDRGTPLERWMIFFTANQA